MSTKVFVSLVRAEGILAADKGGTSDAYAIAELVDSATGKPIKPARKTKTKTIKKTLNPEWNESEVEWSNLNEDTSMLSLKVTVFDADMMSSETLGGVTIPLSTFGDQATESTFALNMVGKMKVAATGSVTLRCRTAAPAPAATATVDPAPAAGSATDATATATTDAAAAAVTGDAGDAKEDSKDDANPPPPSNTGGAIGAADSLRTVATAWVQLVSAKGIIAADKGGTSDAYAIAELVDSATGKPIKPARKTKTKTIKKTLNPEWNESEVEWANLDRDASSLSLKVTVFDADMMSSETLGGVTIPLSTFGDQATESTFALDMVGKMKVAATGSVTLRCRTAAPAPAATATVDPAPAAGSATDATATDATLAARLAVEGKGDDEPTTATVWVQVISAEGILAADKGGTSDAYAIAELVDSANGKPIKPARKTKTKTIKKTLNPEWNESEVEWPNLDRDTSSLSLKVTVFDADMMSSETLGGVTIALSSLTELPARASFPLGTVGKMKTNASGTVTLQLSMRAPRSIVQPSALAASQVEASQGPSRAMWIRLVSAKGILAADKGGTSDAYAIAELVDSANGKPIKPARKTKTKTIKKTLDPEWNESEVEWPNLDQDASELSLKVTVFDADMLSSEALGGVTIPVSAFSSVAIDLSLPLERVGKMKSEATGTIQLRGRTAGMSSGGVGAGDAGLDSTEGNAKGTAEASQKAKQMEEKDREEEEKRLVEKQRRLEEERQKQALIDAPWNAYDFSEEDKNDVGQQVLFKYQFPVTQEWSDATGEELQTFQLKAQWLNTVVYDGMRLRDAPEELQSDRDVVLAAISNNAGALQYAADDLWSDCKFVLAAVAQEGYFALQFAAEELWSNREFVLATVPRFGYVLQVASDDLKGDSEIVFAAVQHHDGAFHYAATELWVDREFVLKAIDVNWHTALSLTCNPLKADREVIVRAFGYHNTLAYHHDVVSALSFVQKELRWLPPANEDLLEERVKMIGARERLAEGYLGLPPEAQLSEEYKSLDTDRENYYGSLNAALVDNSIALIRSDYLIGLVEKGEILGHCAQLPGEAFYDGPVHDGVLVLCFSYIWTTENHPDPDGVHLKDLVMFLRWVEQTEENEHKKVVVFIDWASLYQDLPTGTRTLEQTATYMTGTRKVNLLFGHPLTVTLQSKRTPAGRKWTFDESGWPYFEEQISLVAKKRSHVLELQPIIDWLYNDSVLPEDKLDYGQMVGAVVEARAVASAAADKIHDAEARAAAAEDAAENAQFERIETELLEEMSTLAGVKAVEEASWEGEEASLNEEIAAAAALLEAAQQEVDQITNRQKKLDEQIAKEEIEREEAGLNARRLAARKKDDRAKIQLLLDERAPIDEKYSEAAQAKGEADAKAGAAKAVYDQTMAELASANDTASGKLAELRKEHQQRKDDKRAAAVEQAMQEEKDRCAAEEAQRAINATKTAARRRNGEGPTTTTMWFQVVSAEGILAADKGGTSDAYAIAELVDSATGKPIQPARKTKTKTIKKTLNPEWNATMVEWANLDLDALGLSLKVTVFDADMMSSEALGGAIVPLASIAEGWRFQDVTMPLAKVDKMKEDATGTVLVRMRLRRRVSPCEASHRQLPVLPSSFNASIAEKTFSFPVDKPFLQYKYEETFSRAVTRIHSLNFSHMEVSLQKWQTFIDEVLPLLSGLTVLKLHRNRELVVDVEVLMRTCSSTLQTLNLRHTGLFGDGVKALTGFPNLDRVDVDDSNITGTENEIEAVLPNFCELNTTAHEEAAAEAAKLAAIAKAKADAEAKANAEKEQKEMEEIRRKVKLAISKKVCLDCEESVVDRVEQELFDHARGDQAKFVPILKQLMEATNADEGIKEKLLDGRMNVRKVVEWYGDLIG